MNGTLVILPPPKMEEAYEDYMQALESLEQAAISDGYSLTHCITSFRKLYYDNPGFDVILKHGIGIPLPPSWAAMGEVGVLRSNKVIPINGKQTDMGHLFPGLDADTNLYEIPGVGLNKNAATYVGDLGSVVGEFLMREVFLRRTYTESQILGTFPPEIDAYYDGDKHNLDLQDFNGDIDSFMLKIIPSFKLAQNMRNYYEGTSSQHGQHGTKFTNFARMLGLGNIKIRNLSSYQIIGGFEKITAFPLAQLAAEVAANARAYVLATFKFWLDTEQPVIRRVAILVVEMFLRRLRDLVITEQVELDEQHLRESKIYYEVWPPDKMTSGHDSLWRIAQMFYKNGTLWKFLWENNRSELRSTKSGKPNPNLIYPGELIWIPPLP